jgi:hypothetical protein
MVDNFDNIVHTVDSGGKYNHTEAQRYFINLKQISSEKFIKMWRVMTETEYNRRKFNRETITEYEEFGDWLDLEKS